MRAPPFQWPINKRIAFELVRRGIGGRTVRELGRTMSAAEFADWKDYRAMVQAEETQAGKAKKRVIKW